MADDLSLRGRIRLDTTELEAAHGKLKAVVADSKTQFATTTAVAGASTKATASHFEKLSESLRKSKADLLDIGKVGAGLFAGEKFVEFTKSAIDAASDLNEQVNKTNVVFGKNAAAIHAWSDTAATSIGQSKRQAEEAAGTFGNLFVSMKLAPDAAAAMSKSLVGLGSDLASFNNASPAEALAAIRSGLVGETEPLRKFGVNLNEATLKAKALELGLKATGATLDPAVRAQAAYALILEQTTTAQGDFARTSDGLANSQRIATAKIEDAAAKLGQSLLPVVQAGTVATGELAGHIDLLLPALAGLAVRATALKGVDIVGSASIQQGSKDLQSFLAQAGGSRASLDELRSLTKAERAELEGMARSALTSTTTTATGFGRVTAAARGAASGIKSFALSPVGIGVAFAAASEAVDAFAEAVNHAKAAAASKQALDSLESDADRIAQLWQHNTKLTQGQMDVQSQSFGTLVGKFKGGVFATGSATEAATKLLQDYGSRGGEALQLVSNDAATASEFLDVLKEKNGDLDAAIQAMADKGFGQFERLVEITRQSGDAAAAAAGRTQQAHEDSVAAIRAEIRATNELRLANLASDITNAYDKAAAIRAVYLSRGEDIVNQLEEQKQRELDGIEASSAAREKALQKQQDAAQDAIKAIDQGRQAAVRRLGDEQSDLDRVAEDRLRALHDQLDALSDVKQTRATDAQRKDLEAQIRATEDATKARKDAFDAEKQRTTDLADTQTKAQQDQIDKLGDQIDAEKALEQRRKDELDQKYQVLEAQERQKAALEANKAVADDLNATEEHHLDVINEQAKKLGLTPQEYIDLAKAGVFNLGQVEDEWDTHNRKVDEANEKIRLLKLGYSDLQSSAIINDARFLTPGGPSHFAEGGIPPVGKVSLGIFEGTEPEVVIAKHNAPADFWPALEAMAMGRMPAMQLSTMPSTMVLPAPAVAAGSTSNITINSVAMDPASLAREISREQAYQSKLR